MEPEGWKSTLRRRLPTIGVEFAALVFGVLLALVVELAEELRTGGRRPLSSYLMILGGMPARLVASGDTLSVYGEGNIQLQSARIRNTAWEVAQATQATTHMDPDIVTALSVGYEESLLQKYRETAVLIGMHHWRSPWQPRVESRCPRTRSRRTARDSRAWSSAGAPRGFCRTMSPAKGLRRAPLRREARGAEPSTRHSNTATIMKPERFTRRPGTLVPGLLLFLATLASCGSARPDESAPPGPDLPGIGDGVTVYDDVPYDSGESAAWTLDLALPAGESVGLRPAIVLVHGGGWRAGWKQDRVFRSLLLDYANQGYVTLSVEYRLDGEAPFPASVADVKCSVRWLRAHAAELGVDPDRIGAYGHSAGAHLALMLAVATDSAGVDGEECDWLEYSSKIAAVAAGATPTEAGARLQDQWGRADWWPIGYISSDVPPILLLQGIDDPVVRVDLVDDYVAKMEAAGAEIEYVRIPGGHGVAYEEALDVTKPAMDAFFARTLSSEEGPS